MPDIYKAEKDKKEKDHAKEDSQYLHVAKHKNHPKSRNVLSSFCYYPRKADFSAKDPEEVVILLLRKHPITNLKWILISIVMLLAPIVLNYVPIFKIFPIPANYQEVFIIGWYVLTLAYIFENFLSWFFNVNIVTDERIFDVDFVNLIYREITDANTEQIQDVTVKVGSVIRTIFNYGDVQIQTAGEIPQIEFHAVPQPDRVARIIRELRIEEEKEKLEGKIR